MPQKHAQLRVQPPWVSLNSHSCMTRLCLSPSAPLKAWFVWTFSSFLIPGPSEVSSVGPELGGVVPLLVVRVSLRLVFNWLVIVVGFGSLWRVFSPVWGARCPFSLSFGWDMCTYTGSCCRGVLVCTESHPPPSSSSVLPLLGGSRRSALSRSHILLSRPHIEKGGSGDLRSRCRSRGCLRRVLHVAEMISLHLHCGMLCSLNIRPHISLVEASSLVLYHFLMSLSLFHL